MAWFFTADQHYGHANIIKYCDRPFKTLQEMDEELIRRHNSVVTPQDVTLHIGDFTLTPDYNTVHKKYVKRLNGTHIFLRGSHDYWLKGGNYREIWLKEVEGQWLAACHYAMRTWPRAHYGSWNIHGHSHGTLVPTPNQMDVGVDCWEYTPVSFAQLRNPLKCPGYDQMRWDAHRAGHGPAQ